jgi:hypothetical protein
MPIQSKTQHYKWELSLLSLCAFLAKGQRIWDLLIVVDKNHPKIELENKSSKGFTYKKREPQK